MGTSFVSMSQSANIGGYIAVIITLAVLILILIRKLELFRRQPIYN
jgi:hypothetical protein